MDTTLAIDLKHPFRSTDMVITILEAQVAPERWDTLRDAYAARAQVPASGPVLESFLTQSTEDDRTWRIVTVWRDREALEAMRNSGEPPRGVLIFRDADAEPRLTIFRVWANPRAPV
jgi:quinol monooxygenase YgiN